MCNFMEHHRPLSMAILIQCMFGVYLFFSGPQQDAASPVLDFSGGGKVDSGHKRTGRVPKQESWGSSVFTILEV